MQTPDQLAQTLYAAQSRIDQIAFADSEKQAERYAGEALGYIVAIREHQRIEHEHYVKLAARVDSALHAWYLNRPDPEHFPNPVG